MYFPTPLKLFKITTNEYAYLRFTRLAVVVDKTITVSFYGKKLLEISLGEF